MLRTSYTSPDRIQDDLPAQQVGPRDATVTRLIVVPEPVGDLTPNRTARFVAHLESTGEIVVRSDQPLVDSARILLERGHDPAALLTLRHQNEPFDSFEPASLGRWAAITYKEGERTPLRMTSYEERPFAAAGEWQKSSSAAAAGLGGPAGPGAVLAAETESAPGATLWPELPLGVTPRPPRHVRRRARAINRQVRLFR